MSDEQRLLIDRRELLLTAAGTAALCAVGHAASMADGVRIQFGRRQAFDLGWRFHRGSGAGFEARDFDDSAWRSVDVPHDWSIEDVPEPASDEKSSTVGPFTRSAKEGTAVGFTIGGEGWYRKRFHLNKPTDGRVEIVFEGVYMDSDVWLNGERVGGQRYGYTPFVCDLTTHLAADGNNVLVVRARNLGANSRWYAGSGLYRHVWLDVFAERPRIARWGVGVVTRRIADGNADLEITTRLEEVSAGLTLVSSIKDSAGRVVHQLAQAADAEVKQTASLAAARLWSPEDPQLYALETELRRGRTVVDRDVNTFGIRIVQFDAARGMTLNGVSTKLRGGCIHHDNGLLGAAAFDAAEERKVRLLKARGFNAVRPSHNPFSRAFLDACDRLGMLVIAETFDVWRDPKLPQDYSQFFDARWRADVNTIVLSARNHPSVIMWSIGNEIAGRNTQHGLRAQWELANEVHRLDPTRPVTAAINGFAGRPVIPTANTARSGEGGVAEPASTVFLDVIGYNYKLADYEDDHARYPQRVFYGSESFPKDAAQIWALTNRSAWLIGDFVWTAMDYLGEAGIGGSVSLPETSARNPLALMSAWPWVNAFCGDVDLIGNQKPQSRARDVLWGLSPLEIAVQRPLPDGHVDVPRIWGWPDEQPSWTWPGFDGKRVVVRVYTCGDRVDLYVNGRQVGSQTLAATNLQRIEVALDYAPGVLEAVAFQEGKEIARRRLVTVAQAAAVRLRPERQQHRADRSEVSFIAVEIVDANGQIVPDAMHEVTITLEGPVDLAAFGSANPLAVGSFQSRTAKTWDGRALLILRGRGRTGAVKVVATCAGLRADETLLHLS